MLNLWKQESTAGAGGDVPGEMFKGMYSQLET